MINKFMEGVTIKTKSTKMSIWCCRQPGDCAKIGNFCWHQGFQHWQLNIAPPGGTNQERHWKAVTYLNSHLAYSALGISLSITRSYALGWIMILWPLRSTPTVSKKLAHVVGWPCLIWSDQNTRTHHPHNTAYYTHTHTHTHTHTDLLTTLAATGHVRAVFVGHDHGNDWCCPHGTMTVCFGRHTGYGGYGR